MREDPAGLEKVRRTGGMAVRYVTLGDYAVVVSFAAPK